MGGLVKYIVDCRRGPEVIASYELPQAETLAGPPPQPVREALEKDAKENLSLQGLAHPPFDGVTFHIRRG